MAAGLRDAFQMSGDTLTASLTALEAELAKLDPTLVDAARHAGSKMKYQLERLRARADAAELRQSDVLDRHAAYWSKHPTRTVSGTLMCFPFARGLERSQD
jgi:hypothetical protein